MAIGHAVPGLRQAQANWWCPAKKDTTHVANCSVAGQSRLKPPPPCCTLLCGRGIEAQTPPPKKNTDIALCYVRSVLHPTLPLDCVWHILRVLRILGVASGTAFGV